jgi:hypothetical protein
MAAGFSRTYSIRGARHAHSYRLPLRCAGDFERAVFAVGACSDGFGVAAVVAVSGAEADVVGDALPAIQSNLMDFDIHQKSHLAARELRSNISS